jgi:hypothetical protein
MIKDTIREIAEMFKNQYFPFYIPKDWQVKIARDYDIVYKKAFNYGKLGKRIAKSDFFLGSLYRLHNGLFTRNVDFWEYSSSFSGAFTPLTKNILGVFNAKYKKHPLREYTKSAIQSTFKHELFHGFLDLRRNFESMNRFAKKKNPNNIPYFDKLIKRYFEVFEPDESLFTAYNNLPGYNLKKIMEEHLTNLASDFHGGYKTGDKFLDREFTKFGNRLKRAGLKSNYDGIITWHRPYKRKTTINVDIDMMYDKDYFDTVIRGIGGNRARRRYESGEATKNPIVKQQLKTNTKANNYFIKSKKALKGIFKLITAM